MKKSVYSLVLMDTIRNVWDVLRMFCTRPRGNTCASSVWAKPGSCSCPPLWRLKKSGNCAVSAKWAISRKCSAPSTALPLSHIERNTEHRHDNGTAGCLRFRIIACFSYSFRENIWYAIIVSHEGRFWKTHCMQWIFQNHPLFLFSFIFLFTFLCLFSSRNYYEKLM